MRVTNYWQDDGDDWYDLELSATEVAAWNSDPDAIPLTGNTLLMRKWYDRHSGGSDIYDPVSHDELFLPEAPIPVEQTSFINWKYLKAGADVEWNDVVDGSIEEFHGHHTSACNKLNLAQLQLDAIADAVEAQKHAVYTGGKAPLVVPTLTSVPEADEFLTSLIKED